MQSVEADLHSVQILFEPNFVGLQANDIVADSERVSQVLQNVLRKAIFNAKRSSKVTIQSWVKCLRGASSSSRGTSGDETNMLHYSIKFESETAFKQLYDSIFDEPNSKKTKSKQCLSLHISKLICQTLGGDLTIKQAKKEQAFSDTLAFLFYVPCTLASVYHLNFMGADEERKEA